jgi:ABC-type iron transport system FetAB ATPase subunit
MPYYCFTTALLLLYYWFTTGIPSVVRASFATTLVRNLDINLADGQSLLIMGPSGAGPVVKQ